MADDDMIVEEIQVRRMRKGEWIEKLLRLSWHPATCSLEIAGEYRKTKGTWYEVDLYRVETIPAQAPFVGSAYILHRSQAAIDKDPDKIARYETLVGLTEAKDICSCRGHYGNDHCKHANALRWLGSKLTPSACGKCGQTDCELTGGLCNECVEVIAVERRAEQKAAIGEAAPAWLESYPEYESEIPF